MKQDIENIIKKNLPEKKELNKITKLIEENIYLIAINKGRNLSTTQYEVAKDNLSSQFNELMNINTSLIADEVLKVMVEKIKNQEKSIHNRIWSKTWLAGYFTALEELLSNLSHNKENKNNE